MTKILVAYASKHGSTAEIAQSIGQTLRENHHEVDVLSVEDVKQIEKYQALILGSAVYSGRWMKEAVSFLRTHQFNELPIYLFSSGPIGNAEPHELLDGYTIPELVKDLTKDLNLCDVQIFHGKIDLRKLSLAELMLFKSVGAQSGDFRRWDAIKLWAQHVSDKLLHVHHG
jgi:menaquinone-dependent protoporphyrinogen oxidase